MRTRTEANLNKKRRVDDRIKVARKILSLGSSVRDNINFIKAAGQSRATYGAAVDPFTVAQISALRAKYTQALWPNKYVACRTVGRLIVDKGEVEPGTNVVKNNSSTGLDKLKEDYTRAPKSIGKISIRLQGMLEDQGTISEGPCRNLDGRITHPPISQIIKDRLDTWINGVISFTTESKELDNKPGKIVLKIGATTKEWN